MSSSPAESNGKPFIISGRNRATKAAELADTLFSGREQQENFNRIAELFRVEEVAPSSRPMPWKKARADLALPGSFQSLGDTLVTEEYLKRTNTTALLVIKGGEICFEQYWLTGGRNVHWLSMSVAKSVTSALLGAARADGRFGGVSEPITQYLPDLKGSGYDGVSIKDVLQMSSGVTWNEDYSDPDASVAELVRTLGDSSSPYFLARESTREHTPGTYNRYCSIDTVVLGALLERLIDSSTAKYTHEKLWEPLGCENAAHWILDKGGAALTYVGFNATARDYARVGELYLRGGVWNGAQVLPADWVKASVTPDAPHLAPGLRDSADLPYGYGYQWWLLDDGSFTATGIYNQFVFVSPEHDTVIVKLSANQVYGTSADPRAGGEVDTAALLQAIARSS